MTVKEIIILLQQCNEDLEVTIGPCALPGEPINDVNVFDDFIEFE